jgi:predicted lipoprotein with Yx(FWY)xxD motif
MLKQLTAAGLLLSAIALAAPANAASYGMGSSGSSAPSMQAPSGKMQMTMAPWHRTRTSKGWIWVDSRGFALYTFEKDTPGRSRCYGDCAVEWPPFRVAMGAKASGNWSIVWRFGMSRQWAYNGHPLYFWFKDKRPGQVTGDGEDGFHVAR